MQCRGRITAIRLALSLSCASISDRSAGMIAGQALLSAPFTPRVVVLTLLSAHNLSYEQIPAAKRCQS